jgi:hypothetical protein
MVKKFFFWAARSNLHPRINPLTCQHGRQRPARKARELGSGQNCRREHAPVLQGLHDALVERQQVARPQERVRARLRFFIGQVARPVRAIFVQGVVDGMKLGECQGADGIGGGVQGAGDGVGLAGDGGCVRERV